MKTLRVVTFLLLIFIGVACNYTQDSVEPVQTPTAQPTPESTEEVHGATEIGGLLGPSVGKIGHVSGKNGRANPFLIGQIIYPTVELLEFHDEIALELEKGVEVVDKTADLVRVQLNNGKLHVFGWAWFTVVDLIPSQSSTDSYEEFDYEWKIGNTFVIGNDVCALPDSEFLKFPDKGVVIEINDQHIRIDTSTHSEWLHWSHFQLCSDLK